MKKSPTMSLVTGTPFIKAAPIKDRRSHSASLRGGRHPVSGVAAAFTTAPIDSPAAAEVAICAPATPRLADAGFYTFRIIDSGTTEYVPARHTLVYENREGEWPIAHHYSSLMP